MDKRERFKISCIVMETLTGSPGRPLGPKSPSSPWKDTEKQQGWKDADWEVTDVLRSVWNHFKFCSHIFIPSLHPLLEVLGVPSLLCHPGETQSRRVRSQNNSQTDIQVLSYYTYSKPNNALLPLLPLVTIIILCEVYVAFWLTLCPLSPGKPGRPSKPRSPWETHRYVGYYHSVVEDPVKPGLITLLRCHPSWTLIISPLQNGATSS